MLPLYIDVERYSEERMIALVNYVEEMKPVDYYYSNGEAIIGWMKTKVTVWSYEEEIRIILNKCFRLSGAREFYCKSRFRLRQFNLLWFYDLK